MEMPSTHHGNLVKCGCVFDVHNAVALFTYHMHPMITYQNALSSHKSLVKGGCDSHGIFENGVPGLRWDEKAEQGNENVEAECAGPPVDDLWEISRVDDTEIVL